jgi:hypothetical protein
VASTATSKDPSSWSTEEAQGPSPRVAATSRRELSLSTIATSEAPIGAKQLADKQAHGPGTDDEDTSAKDLADPANAKYSARERLDHCGLLEAQGVGNRIGIGTTGLDERGKSARARHADSSVTGTEVGSARAAKTTSAAVDVGVDGDPLPHRRHLHTLPPGHDRAAELVARYKRVRRQRRLAVD